jgi:hypothetical protein
MFMTRACCCFEYKEGDCENALLWANQGVCVREGIADEMYCTFKDERWVCDACMDVLEQEEKLVEEVKDFLSNNNSTDSTEPGGAPEPDVEGFCTPFKQCHVKFKYYTTSYA